VTAFPLLYELNILASFFSDGSGSLDPAGYSGLAHWVMKVRDGLEQTYKNYPFIAYGTDWLAFGHIIIALFFIHPLRDPIRYKGNYDVAVWASVLVIPLAFFCGLIREIPVYWRLVDCAFGVVALIPLFYIKALINSVEEKGLLA